MLKTNMLDVLKKARRMPQVILPKDAAMIVAYTGVSPGWNVIDAGTGSGWLAMFLANIVKPGKVVSYERNEIFAKNVVKIIKDFNIDNLKVINKDVLRAKPRGRFDLATLDLKNAENLVPKIFKLLNDNGYVAVYSPHIEQVKRVRKVIEKLGFVGPVTIENIVREWKVTDDFTHPVPSGVLHTGFLTVAKKAGIAKSGLRR